MSVKECSSFVHDLIDLILHKQPVKFYHDRRNLFKFRNQHNLTCSSILHLISVFESSLQTSKSDQDSFSDRARTPDSTRLVVNGASEESRSARILKHLQSRVKQLRQGNESMKKSFGSDEGENELDSSAGSATFERVNFKFLFYLYDYEISKYTK